MQGLISSNTAISRVYISCWQPGNIKLFRAHYPEIFIIFVRMSSQMLSLFDGEVAPDQMDAAGKSHAVPEEQQETKKKEVKAEQEDILQGWKADKQYYSIGEVAGLFGINTSNIRFWTKEFELKLRTTRKGDRLYTPNQVREIRTIYSLVKEQGFTIAGAKAKIKADKKSTVEAVDLKQSLLQLRNKLILMRNQLS
ncbi:MAG: MerR family transcriptional regulator [Sphingobacteriales bacterium]|nr:MAG: MerR family transcriptional regulator [Sphingobacteriales bacterium]